MSIVKGVEFPRRDSTVTIKIFKTAFKGSWDSDVTVRGSEIYGNWCSANWKQKAFFSIIISEQCFR